MAFIAAQARFSLVSKDAKNKMFDSKYSTLESLIKAVREPLAEVGLAIMQFPTVYIDGTCLWIAIETIMVHTSGEWISHVFRMQISSVAKKDASNPTQNAATASTASLVVTPQSVGSAETYARRYALLAFLGLSSGTEDDDDGNVASNLGSTQRQERPWGVRAETRAEQIQQPPQQQPQQPPQKKVQPAKQEELGEEGQKLLAEIGSCESIEKLQEVWRKVRPALYAKRLTEAEVECLKVTRDVRDSDLRNPPDPDKDGK